MYMDKKIILMKPNQTEIMFDDLCEKEYLKLTGLMGMIENEFGVSLHDYPELRNRILDVSNFIKRMPNYFQEVL